MRVTAVRSQVHALSLAVFAFAVDDMNERERKITSARPFASLATYKYLHIDMRLSPILVVSV